MVDHILELLHHSWLPAGSFFAGVLNSIAGGGSFLSLPALFASAAGTGAVALQATNTVALWPGQLTGMVAFRKELREYKRELLPLGLAAGLGGWIGGQLLLRTGNHMFLKLLPWQLQKTTTKNKHKKHKNHKKKTQKKKKQQTTLLI